MHSERSSKPKSAESLQTSGSPTNPYYGLSHTYETLLNSIGRPLPTTLTLRRTATQKRVWQRANHFVILRHSQWGLVCPSLVSPAPTNRLFPKSCIRLPRQTGCFVIFAHGVLNAFRAWISSNASATWGLPQTSRVSL